MYSVSLKVRSLYWAGIDAEQPQDTGRIPSNLPYRDECLRTDDIVGSEVAAGGTKKTSKSSSSKLPQSQTSIDATAHSAAEGYPGLRSRKGKGREIDVAGAPDTAGSSSHGQGEGMREVLSKMLPVCPLHYHIFSQIARLTRCSCKLLPRVAVLNQHSNLARTPIAGVRCRNDCCRVLSETRQFSCHQPSWVSWHPVVKSLSLSRIWQVPEISEYIYDANVDGTRMMEQW